MIGKRKAWDSNFTIKDLEKEGLTVEHNPFYKFPFLALKGFRMEEIDKLICPPCNSPRGYKEIFTSKQEPLESSLLEGWWVHSWLIPLLKGMYFDRRHTIKTLLKLIAERKLSIKYVPVADYERVYVDHEPLISSFDDLSIMTMIGVAANVAKSDDDAKTDHFVNSIVAIIDREYELIGDPELKTKGFIRKLLTYMGAYRRFSDVKGHVSTAITDKIYNTVNGNTQTVVGKLTFNVEKDNVDSFMQKSDEWDFHNRQDDEYEYRKYAIDTIKDHYRLVADKIMQQVYTFDNLSRKNSNDPHRTLKVLIFCEQSSKFNASHAENIEKARDKFLNWFNDSYYNGNKCVTNKFKESLGKYYDENVRLLSEYKLEIYWLPQIEDEDPDKAIPVNFDLNGLRDITRFNKLDEEFGTREG